MSPTSYSKPLSEAPLDPSTATARVSQGRSGRVVWARLCHKGAGEDTASKGTGENLFMYVRTETSVHCVWEGGDGGALPFELKKKVKVKKQHADIRTHKK